MKCMTNIKLLLLNKHDKLSLRLKLVTLQQQKLHRRGTDSFQFVSMYSRGHIISQSKNTDVNNISNTTSTVSNITSPPTSHLYIWMDECVQSFDWWCKTWDWIYLSTKMLKSSKLFTTAHIFVVHAGNDLTSFTLSHFLPKDQKIYSRKPLQYIFSLFRGNIVQQQYI